MDIKLHYIEKGSGEPLVLLHGNGESGDYFSSQIDFFSAWYRVLAVDTRGHGRSPRGTGAFTLSRFADDLYDFLARLQIPRANILGFSDGGNIALLFALSHPEKVSRLILNGANFRPSGLKWRVLAPICAARISAALRAPFNKSAVSEKERLSLMTTQLRIKPAELRRICVPALVIAGSRDMIRGRHTEKLARCLEDARLVILDGTHFIASENSRPFNEAVLRFLREYYEM